MIIARPCNMADLPSIPTSSLGNHSNPPSLVSNATGHSENNTQRSPSLNDPATSQDLDQPGYISPCQQSTPWTWAITIILGQLTILAIAWSFFGVVYHYGPIPLPDKMATRVTTHQRSANLIITLLATTLSLTSALYKPFMTTTGVTYSNGSHFPLVYLVVL